MRPKGRPRIWCPAMVPGHVLGVRTKATYASRREAEAHGNAATRAYRCQHCGRYHLTTKNGKG